MKKTFIILTSLLFVTACAKSVPSNPQNTGTASRNDATAKIYTMADVKQANNASNCLTTIGGKVYNLTGWINQHPGGDTAILSLCGTDGTAAFNAQHGNQGRPVSILQSYEVGMLSGT